MRSGLLVATLAALALVVVAGWAVLFSSPQLDSPQQPARHCSLHVVPKTEFPAGHVVVCGPAQ